MTPTNSLNDAVTQANGEVNESPLLPMTEESIADETRCKYPGKFCGRARACKANGTFHRYCQYHRTKANTNQKRWTTVRRQQLTLEEQQNRLQAMLMLSPPLMPSFPMDTGAIQSSSSMPVLLPDPVRLGECPDPADLSLEDAHILNALLIDESPYDDHEDDTMVEPRTIQHTQTPMTS